jgi:hypothetical protein
MEWIIIFFFKKNNILSSTRFSVAGILYYSNKNDFLPNEGTFRMMGHGSSQQGLASTRRPIQQDTYIFNILNWAKELTRKNFYWVNNKD